MGMYDTVMVPCPACGRKVGFQSKSGDCTLETFSLEDAPDCVLHDVNRHAPAQCAMCDTLFYVELTGPRRTLVARSVVAQP